MKTKTGTTLLSTVCQILSGQYWTSIQHWVVNRNVLQRALVMVTVIVKIIELIVNTMVKIAVWKMLFFFQYLPGLVSVFQSIEDDSNLT